MIIITKRKDITYRIFVSISGVDIPWDTLSLEKKKEISKELNDRAMRAIGYRPVEDKTA